MGWIVLFGIVFSLGLLLYEILRRAGHRSPDPTCMRCGYCVRGIPALTCPECGSDLREVGIRPPRPALPGIHPFTAILIWTLLVVAPPAFFWNGYIATYGPFHFTWRQYPAVQSTFDFLPLTLNVVLEGESTEPRHLTDHRVDRMLVAPNSMRSPAGMLIVDTRAGTYEYADTQNTRVTRSGPLTPAVVREWLASHHYPVVPDPSSNVGINELAAILIAMKNGDQTSLQRYIGPARNQTFRRAGGPPIPRAPILAVVLPSAVVTSRYTLRAYALLITLPLLLWLIGTLVILRRGRKNRPPAPVPTLA